MVNVSHSPALGYMQVISILNAAIVFPIIEQHVHPGTVVHSDEWAAYHQVQQLPSVKHYSWVNNSLTFVDPITGTHTQNI